MQDKIIVITGAFGALGRVVAQQSAERGLIVAAVDVAPKAPVTLIEALGSRGATFPGTDIGDSQTATQLLKSIKEKFGRIDAIVNIAGGFRWETIADGDTETWNTLYDMNVRTALNVSKAALPYLLEQGGSIVNIGANAAVKAASGMGAYAASKAGVHRLTEALAEELKGKGVTVNAILPSIIDTEANRADMPDADFAKWVTPRQLAGIILFLVSEQATAITGALIPVTGGV